MRCGLLVAGLQLRIQRRHLGQHLAGQLGHGARAQALQVLGFERVHIEHGLIVRSLGDGRHRGILELPQRYLARCE